MDSLISQFRRSRQTVTTLMGDHDDAMRRLHYFAHRAHNRSIIIVTVRRQIDALNHLRSIRPAFKPSKVIIRAGPNENQDDLLRLVTDANLDCRVVVANEPVMRQSSRDFSRYASEYYNWRAAEERLEDAKRLRSQLLEAFKDVHIVTVSALSELTTLIEIRNGGGWTGGNIIIPDYVDVGDRGDVTNAAVEEGIVVLPWNQFANSSR